MKKDQLEKLYSKYIEEFLNDFDYTDIDCFCEDNELTQEEIKYILNLKLKVIPVERGKP